MTRAIAVAFLCLFAFGSAADAKPRHIARIAIAESNGCVLTNEGRQICSGAVQRASEPRRVTASYDGGTVLGGRPAGCPHAYCGCGAARYLGLTDKRLNRAWSWAELFPRASPGAGMAVVWRHHVALIESMTGPHEALLRDYNSGKGLSRLHVRSISGAVVVNPHSRTAMR